MKTWFCPSNPRRRTSGFVALYEAHAGAVLAYARRRIGPDGAEDVLAETFLVAWRRRARRPARRAAMALRGRRERASATGRAPRAGRPRWRPASPPSPSARRCRRPRPAAARGARRAEADRPRSPAADRVGGPVDRPRGTRRRLQPRDVPRPPAPRPQTPRPSLGGTHERLMERLRAADPVAEEPDAPPVEWMLARVDAAAPRRLRPPPGRSATRAAAPPGSRRGRGAAAVARRVRRRRPLLAGLAAATALAAVGVLAGTWSSPDVVAEASEALGPPRARSCTR